MKYSVLFLFFIATIFISCSSESDSVSEKKYLPPSSGTHTEMILVVEENIWKSRTGKALIDVFGQDQDGLPQSEPIFALNHVAPPGFQGLLKRAKSLVFVQRSDTVLIETKKNVWAQPQLVTTITAPTEKEILQLIKRNEHVLIDVYHKGDIEVVQNRMEKFIYQKVPETLHDLNIKNMMLQRGFAQTLDKKDLKIFRQETKKTTQFLVFSTRPMPENTIPGQDIIVARDSIGKRYFEGHAEGSYFATEMILPPVNKNAEIDGRFAIETRGLWKTVGYIMGGPFVSYTIYNDEKNEILTLEGFLFGPDAKKRNVLLEMEAMMKSIEFSK